MLAKKIGEKLNAEIFFTQFHAETNYSDFIYGIKPNLNQSNLNYQEQKGIFLRALQIAIKNPSKNVLLIIDELNRANLSNILGPIFYLFEYQMDDNSVDIEICNGFYIKKIPENFYVIGTMNTADRSLAVVDFALRRRFAWYTLKPRILETKTFFKDDFLKFQEIFDWYASSEELNLQPGHAYFIANSKEEMTQRIRYELFPLIREYLSEGIMLKAKEFQRIFFG
jgi:5-methylcytosine-specific restriction protein B